MKAKVRTKACPYCGKKLQAATKLKFHNNLARHLGRGTCAPYEDQRAARAFMMAQFVGSFLGSLFRGSIPLNPDQVEKQKAEVSELERMFKQEPKSVPPRTPESAGPDSTGKQDKGSS